MTPPRQDDHYGREEHFRFDGEFVKLIQTQSEQKIMLHNMSEKIEDIKKFNSGNFDKLSDKLEELVISIRSVQGNCIAHKVLRDNNNKIATENAELKKNSNDLILHFNPLLIKAIVIIIASLLAYFYGIKLP